MKVTEGKKDIKQKVFQEKGENEGVESLELGTPTGIMSGLSQFWQPSRIVQSTYHKHLS